MSRIGGSVAGLGLVALPWAKLRRDAIRRNGSRLGLGGLATHDAWLAQSIIRGKRPFRDTAGPDVAA